LFSVAWLIWNSHSKFCRRYGLDDGTARFLTSILLFLFSVYPLKFLLNLSITSLLFGAGSPVTMSGSQLSMVLVIYGLGSAAVYLATTLLYLHAYRLRHAPELNELEGSDARYLIFRLSILSVFRVIAAALACVPFLRDWSSLVYVLLFPILRTSGIIHKRQCARHSEATGDARPVTRKAWSEVCLDKLGRRVDIDLAQN
jgi:hypothetical protein